MKLKDHSTYPEFKHWCGQIANILHRLKFITNIIMDNLNDIEPSLVDVHIPNNSDNNYEKHGLIFSKYEKQTHLQYVKSEEESPNIITKYKPTSQAQSNMVEMAELHEEMKDDTLRKDKSISPEFSYSHEEKDEDAPPMPVESQPANNKDEAAVDPFIARDLEVEIYEVINSFDMEKYGEHMARFMIRQIGDFSMDESWVVLGIVMETLPFKLALEILYGEMA
eukprot:401479_1